MLPGECSCCALPSVAGTTSWEKKGRARPIILAEFNKQNSQFELFGLSHVWLSHVGAYPESTRRLFES